jgi:hypothetical protein
LTWSSSQPADETPLYLLLDRPQRRRCLKKICSATCTDARILFVWTAWAPVPTEPVSDMHVRRLVGIPLFVTEAGWDRIFYSSGIGSPTCLGARNFELGTAPCNAMIRCLETLSLLSAPAISYVVAGLREQPKMITKSTNSRTF